jgi:hypothetical protein
MRKLPTAYDEVLDAQRELNRLLGDFGEAAESIAIAKAEAEDPENDTGEFWGVVHAAGYAAELETFQRLLPALRDMLSKFSPETWAEFLEDEAHDAANEAKREAELLKHAKAEGFDSYEAMRKAERHARRSAAAKKAAATRKQTAEWNAKVARANARAAQVQALADSSGATLH